jgi:hypothetical protein
VNEMEQAMEEMKQKDVIYLDDTSDEVSMKEMPKEMICLVDLYNDKNEKENVPNRKCFKKE